MYEASVVPFGGAASNVDAAYQSATTDLKAYVGQTPQLLVEAADAGSASLLEVVIDDVVAAGRI